MTISDLTALPERLVHNLGAESSVKIAMTQVMRPYRAKVGNSDNNNTKPTENALKIRITGLKTAAMLNRDRGAFTAIFLYPVVGACRCCIVSNFQNRLQQFQQRKGRM